MRRGDTARCVRAHMARTVLEESPARERAAMREATELSPDTFPTRAIRNRATKRDGISRAKVPLNLDESAKVVRLRTGLGTEKFTNIAMDVHTK